MNLIRSGVEAPVGKSGGESSDGGELGVPDIVVVRCMFVVSADGGGGSICARLWELAERIEARQRKHSPVPK